MIKFLVRMFQQQTNRQMKKKIRASGQTCGNCHSHLNYRIRNSWMNIESKSTGCKMENGGWSWKYQCWKCYPQIYIEHHFSDINGSVVLDVSSLLWSCPVSHINSECIFHWIWAAKCKVDVRKYLSMLLIVEINENPTWMPQNIIVYVSIGPTIIWPVFVVIIIVRAIASIHTKKNTLAQDNLLTWSGLFV